MKTTPQLTIFLVLLALPGVILAQPTPQCGGKQYKSSGVQRATAGQHGRAHYACGDRGTVCTFIGVDLPANAVNVEIHLYSQGINGGGWGENQPHEDIQYASWQDREQRGYQHGSNFKNWGTYTRNVKVDVCYSTQ